MGATCHNVKNIQSVLYVGVNPSGDGADCDCALKKDALRFKIKR
jgi:hypothetical protein